jgi:hypothetical protein
MDIENLVSEGMEGITENKIEIPARPEYLHFAIREFSDFLHTIKEKVSELFNSNMEYIGDCTGIKECSDALNDIFTNESLEEWPSYSAEQRAQILNDGAAVIGEKLGINIKGIKFENMDSESRGMNSGDGYVVVNSDVLYDPNLLVDAIDTVAHESRHQLQFEAIEHPEQYNIDPEVIESWRNNLYSGYIRPEWDFEGYTKQPVERDAVHFAADIINNILGS